MTVIIIVAVIALLVLWIISVQRKLVSKDELCKNAMSQIGVQQNSRWDALTALAELVKSYDEHEYNTIRDVISQRTSVGRNSTAEDVQGQEQKMSSVLKSINVVAEQYPDLKANANYGKAMESVNTYENQVRQSRMVYNDTVTKYNRMIRQFPDSMVAGMLHFQDRDYLQEPSGKTEMPSMRIK